MSVFGQIFPCAYPRVSSIRKPFAIAACSHLPPGAKLGAIAKDHGFGHFSIDVLTDTELAMLNEQCVSLGMKALALSSAALTPLEVEYARKLDAAPSVEFVLTANEPNSQRFWVAGVGELVEDYRKLRAATGKPIIGGNLAWTDNSLTWIHELKRLGADRFMDLIGVHAYEGAGAETVRRFDEVVRAYRDQGFKQPVWCTEFGYRVSDEKQARWTTYVLSKLSERSECLGASVYELYNATPFTMVEWETMKPRPVLPRIRKARVEPPRAAL